MALRLTALRLGALGVAMAALAAGGCGGSGPTLAAGSVVVVNADRPSLNAHTSPAVAVDSDRGLIVVADRIDSPSFSCSVSVSRDGGRSWRPVGLPLAPGAPNCFWPDVAFTGDGRLLVLYTATAGRYNQPVGVWLQVLEGDLTPSGAPLRVAPSEAFHAHFDAVGQNVVVAWVQAKAGTADQPLGFLPPPNPLMAARSTDGGRTFGTPVRVGEPDRLVAHPVVVIATAGPGGEVLVGGLDLGDDRVNYEALHGGQGGDPPDGRWRVVAWRSSDGGATFGPTVVVASGLVVPERVVIDLMAGPSFARDPSSGVLYAAWDAGRGSERDVYVARSTDGGSSWGPPARLDRPGQQWLPAVAVAPGGRVDVLFYDSGVDPKGVLADAVLASSFDAGRTFALAKTVSDRPGDSRIGLGSSQGLPQHGNQLALASGDDRVLAFWADASGGTVDNGIVDLSVAVVAVRGA